MCPPVRGDNPRALASELSYVHVNTHSITYTTYISVDFANHEIFHAKVGKGGTIISNNETCVLLVYMCMRLLGLPV